MKKVKVKGTIVSNEYKWIYDWFGIDSVCPKEVETQLIEAEGHPITVEVNSGGGDVLAGSEIYYLISTHKYEKTVDVVGLAASAASYIIAAGDNVRIVPTGMVMIHNVSGGASGDYHVMDKESKILQSFNKAISNAYRLKTNLSEKELLKLMDDETWMPAQDAVKKGFVDEIIGDEDNVLSNSTPKNIYNGIGLANIIPDKVIADIMSKFKGPGVPVEAAVPDSSEPEAISTAPVPEITETVAISTEPVPAKEVTHANNYKESILIL